MKQAVSNNKTNIEWLKENIREIKSWIKALAFLLFGQFLSALGTVLFFLINKGF